MPTEVLLTSSGAARPYGRAQRQSTVDSTQNATNRQVDIFGIAVDVVDLAAAVERVLTLAQTRASRGGAPAVVVTPNLDHAVRLRRDASFRHAYDAADLVLADGQPLVLASRLGDQPLPERVAGSDLVAPLCAGAAGRGLSVFILGTSLEILSVACNKLSASTAGLSIVGIYSPNDGFDPAHSQTAEALAMINAARPDILFLALGSPRQELWATALRDHLAVGAVVCVGAAFDFLADRPARAPLLVRRLCMEWLWRLAHDPARFARRYTVDLAYLPLLLIGQLRRSAGRRASPSRAGE